MNLGEMAQVFAGRAVKRAPPDTESRPLRIVGLRDVGRRMAPATELEEVEVLEGDEGGRSLLQPGDVLVTSRGSNVRAAVAQDEHAGAVAGPNLIVVRLGGFLRPELLAAYLRHPVISAQLLREFSGSSTAGFTIDSLRRIDVQVAEGDCADLLADLVQHVDAYSEYQARAVELHQALADEAIFEHLNPMGPQVAR